MLQASRFVILSVFIIVFNSAVHAQAQTLSEPALFNRCYSQLTGRPVPRNHAVMAEIVTGKANALSACDNLLEKAALNPSSGLLNSSTDLEANWILNNFYAFHRSWFPGNTVEQIQNYNDETGLGTRDIYDTTEPGLALTRALFMTGAKYSDVVTLPTGVHAVRQDNAFIRKLIGWSVSFPGRSVLGNNTNSDRNEFNFRAASGGFDGNSDTTNSLFMILPKIETGELIGVRSTTESAVIPNVNMSPLGDSTPGSSVLGLNFSFDIYKTMGGGVLGTPSYVLLNFGHELGLKMNGQVKVPRRWALTTMETFMCATLPALRESDVKSFLVGNSSAPFRNSTSCLQCHSSLDPMAYTARNIMLNSTDFAAINAGSAHPGAKNAFVMSTFRPELDSVTGWPSEPVENFHRQTPSGRLYFRSFSQGDLVNKPVDGIAGLGLALSQVDDYYQCAAKRYFEFFTGIKVPLYDRSNPIYAEMNKSLSANSIADRKFIENLAADLRQSQSVKGLIKTIMASDYYKSPTFRLEGGTLGK
jgi:hypothetical protein